MNCHQGTEEEGQARGGEERGDKVLDRRGDAEVKVAMGHPARELCLQESSWPKTEGRETQHAESNQSHDHFSGRAEG